LTENLFPKPTRLPAQIRVSLGTAIVLGLSMGKLDAKPTTAYLMTYKAGKCTANCSFCSQARASKSNTELLSRVSWPTFSTENMISALAIAVREGKIKRVCIQALNYPSVFGHLETLVKEIKKQASVPVSVSCQPLRKENIVRLAKVGVDRLAIALDASTEALFVKVKGEGAGSVYSWEGQFRMLNDALVIFGKGNVSTHIIAGLGEEERDVVQIIQMCFDMGVLPALFAFTPVRGTALEGKPAPLLESYRRLQLARYLIVKGSARFGDTKFDDNGRIIEFDTTNSVLRSAFESGEPFQTSGCKDCNRPFYNEKPSGPIYNYPGKLSYKEIEEIKQQLSAVFRL